MPKVVRNTFHGAKNMLLTELTERYNKEIKEACNGKNRITAKDFMNYLGCSSYTTTAKYLNGVDRIGNTRMYRTIDIARKFAIDTMTNEELQL